jgi:hypothetical protein
MQKQHVVGTPRRCSACHAEPAVRASPSGKPRRGNVEAPNGRVNRRCPLGGVEARVREKSTPAFAQLSVRRREKSIMINEV